MKTALAKVSANYSSLLTKVKQALVDGQARIEQERVRTYWETGKLIQAHILKSDRAEYGTQVVSRLAKDLGVDHTVLKRCIQFAETYPRLPMGVAQHPFNWTHYVKLITVSDPKKRSAFEDAVIRHGWSSGELALRIKEDQAQEAVEPQEKRPAPQKLLTPLRGQLYTYRLVERPSVGSGEDSGLLIDLGFGVFRSLPSKIKFIAGDIVASVPKSSRKVADTPSSAKGASEELPQYKLIKTDRTTKDLFTYNAYVERVIDGDTLKVRVDLGFYTWHRETLRLRDIDCPEMDTKEGQEAKAYVVRTLMKNFEKASDAPRAQAERGRVGGTTEIKEASLIVVRSSRSDKYDRYLADIFVPDVSLRAEQSSAKQSQEEDLYLNNLLLEKEYAVRME